MKRTLDVYFDGEVLRPEQPLDLPPHLHYVVTIEVEPRMDAGVVDGILALAADLDLPPDFAEQHEHYTHGTPKNLSGK